MDSLADLDDLKQLLYPAKIADADATLFTGLLMRASALLRQKAPHTDARIADGSLDPLIASTVVAGIVKRFIKNPDGASSKTTSTGPYSTSLSFVDRYEGSDGSLAVRGGLQVTKSDLDQLRPAPTAASRLGSIKLGAALAPAVGLQGDQFVPSGLAGYQESILDDPTSEAVVTPIVTEPVEP